MNGNHKNLLITLIAALVIAIGTWLWFTYFEKYWVAQVHVSEAAQKNNMLAATLLLGQHKLVVENQNSLNEKPIAGLANGTLLIAESGGYLADEQVQQMLNWVRKGNTLIMQPKCSCRYGKRKTPATANKTDKTDKAQSNESNNANNEADADSDVDADKDTGADSADSADSATTSKTDVAPAAVNKDLDADPIAHYLGVTLEYRYHEQGEPPTPEVDYTAVKAPTKDDKKNKINTGQIQFGAGQAALQFHDDGSGMHAKENARVPSMTDASAHLIRVYPEGKGHIVLMADNFFDNTELQHFDHAEILLQLMQLNARDKHVVFIHHIDFRKWYLYFWSAFKYAIIGVVIGLLLLLWRALRRFGPMLPDPDHDRRSLIEHIDASGRWLWKIPGGKDILLTAVRNSTNQILHRRAPELQRLHFSEQLQRLSASSQIAQDALIAALQSPAEKHAQAFTRQIHTLQLLRKHYER